jgi:hypothetical protein
VIANLEVTYVAGADRERTGEDLIRQLDSCLFYIGLWTSYSLLRLILPSIHAGSELLERVRRTRGVAGARLDFLQDRTEVYSTLREGVQRRLRDAPAEPFDAEVA